ncbi:unnamed protein product [Clavelina lepadiformis]|uniref:Uncharacterized protein n=1 Tax=Clavelina lepadiformis TaxID=159417 RepID=A0ABP0FDC7_CLALP
MVWEKCEQQSQDNVPCSCLLQSDLPGSPSFNSLLFAVFCFWKIPLQITVLYFNFGPCLILQERVNRLQLIPVHTGMFLLYTKAAQRVKLVDILALLEIKLEGLD